MESFRHFAGDPCNLASDTFFRPVMFQHEPGLLTGQALFQDHKSAMVTNAQSDRLERHRLALQRDMDTGPDAQKNAMASAALFPTDRFFLRQWRGLYTA